MLDEEYNQWIGQVFVVNYYSVEVINVLAEGGYGLVFTVAYEGRPYALKRQMVNNLEMLGRLKMEIRTLERMKGNPNIVPYIDSVIIKKGDDVWEALILLELCEGLTVSQLIMSKPDKILSIEEINNIFLSVVKALAALHHYNPPIIHRDIKIENIISYHENYVLCDFGSISEIFYDPTKCNLQKLQADVEKFTTIPYRSPEMVDLYSGKLISTKCDIWALGCLLYILFYNTAPFGESTLSIQSGVIRFPQEPVIPEGYIELIKFMLDIDPDTRPHISEVASRVFKLANLPCPIEKEPAHAIVPKSTAKIVSDMPIIIKSPNVMNKRVATIPIATSVAPRIRPKSRSDHNVDSPDNLNLYNSPSPVSKTQNTAPATIFNEMSQLQFLDPNNSIKPKINTNLDCFNLTTDIFGQKTFSVENNDSSFISFGSTSFARNSEACEIISDQTVVKNSDIFEIPLFEKNIKLQNDLTHSHKKSKSACITTNVNQISKPYSLIKEEQNMIDSKNETENKSKASKIASAILNKFNYKKNCIEL